MTKPTSTVFGVFGTLTSGPRTTRRGSGGRRRGRLGFCTGAMPPVSGLIVLPGSAGAPGH
ncbi:hypothetical protein [Streptomyces lacrimifluminis]|uniref:hypothetical protein n=1 Tax=Streptomyces lacrimifluminis TaxID=1500077 RepID=UPI0016674CD9|nr:hypothetical protein [Streptomyces lacrimifluminis]